jgi:ankyrin repeat protein
MASMLLERNTDPNIRDSHGWTPLYIAIINTRETMVSTLLKHGADVTVIVDEELPLITAIRYRNFPIITTILNAGYISEYNHCEAIHVAMASYYFDCIPLLLDRGFNVNYQNSTGVTPLHRAVGSWKFRLKDAYDILILLLKAGADSSIVDNKGRTPRMMAPDLRDLFDSYEVCIKEPDCG